MYNYVKCKMYKLYKIVKSFVEDKEPNGRPFSQKKIGQKMFKFNTIRCCSRVIGMAHTIGISYDAILHKVFWKMI